MNFLKNFVYKFRKQLNSKNDIDDSKLIQGKFWSSALIFSLLPKMFESKIENNPFSYSHVLINN